MKSCPVNPQKSILKPKFFGCLICYTAGWISYWIAKRKMSKGQY
ncbi:MULTISPECIES: hypothetical protein [Paenibacillus]|uniref:Uncharacterized protein n=1 Tax=Paenibacillus chondroitinus TaxID=59842 RepID=A0ABU6D8Q9_9BACL|nr:MULTISPECIES: hypothetical protein [Paenibacillus]MEB4793308.1 hypothetical protein [Paenibacillus chondroitinus]